MQGYDQNPNLMISMEDSFAVENSQVERTLALFSEKTVSPRDVARLATDIAHSGKILSWPPDKPTVDLASTGGVGNKTPVIVPILAVGAAQNRLRIPKISTRGAVAGTIDILEAAGYRAEPTLDEYIRTVTEFGLSNILPSSWLAPLDRDLMKRRREVGCTTFAPQL